MSIPPLYAYLRLTPDGGKVPTFVPIVHILDFADASTRDLDRTLHRTTIRYVNGEARLADGALDEHVIQYEKLAKGE